MAADMETYSKQSPEERNCQSAQAKKMMQHLYTPSSID